MLLVDLSRSWAKCYIVNQHTVTAVPRRRAFWTKAGRRDPLQGGPAVWVLRHGCRQPSWIAINCPVGLTQKENSIEDPTPSRGSFLRSLLSFLGSGISVLRLNKAHSIRKLVWTCLDPFLLTNLAFGSQSIMFNSNPIMPNMNR